MLRQYGPGRHRYETHGGRALPVGTVPVGSIVRFRFPRSRDVRTVRVEAWLPREIAAAARDDRGHFTAPRFVARGGHLALVRDLRTGRVAPLADHYLLDD